MRNITPFLLLVSIVFSLVACQKEVSVDTLGSTPGNGGSTGGSGNTSGKTEVGTWKYISTNVVFSQTIEASVGGTNVKTVTTGDITTIKNDGVFKFDGTNMALTGFTYSIDAIAKSNAYLGGTLIQSTDIPVQDDVPPSDFSVGYKKIGSDSLYFASGFPLDISIAGTGQIVSGVKLKFDADKMMMIAVHDETSTQLVQGVSQKMTTHNVVTVTLQKQ